MTMMKAIMMFFLFLFLILTILGSVLLFLQSIKKIFSKKPFQDRQRELAAAAQKRERGIQGEADTVKKIAGILPDAKILTNAYIPCKKGYTEIDIIVLTTWAVYVIENKNYSGSIYGNECDPYWTVVFPNQKYPLYNPVKQNFTHVLYLKKLFMHYGFSGREIRSIVCFNDRATLKQVVSTTPVISTRDLKDYMEREESNYTKGEVERMYRVLKPFTENTDKIKRDHAKRIKRKYG